MPALTVAKAGSGSGTVTSNPAGITCGSTCTHGYTLGAGVVLTATPASGSSFAGWSGACSGTGTCSVTMSQARSVTATFTSTVKAACIVPKLKGKTVPASKRALTKAHCRAGTVTRRYSSVRKGRVISQRPAPGKHLAVGAKIRLVVSRGKKH
jgi:hypothetical protein